MSRWGPPKWDLVISLALAWLLIFAVLIKGVQSAGKVESTVIVRGRLYLLQVVYFTATFPYVLLTILLIRGNLLKNAIEGIKFYMVPKPEKLLEIQANLISIQIIRVIKLLSYSHGPMPPVRSSSR